MVVDIITRTAAPVTAFADLLAEANEVRVIVPVHPGLDGTERPERLTTIADWPGSTPPCSTHWICAT
jgi:hypothetical protein